MEISTFAAEALSRVDCPQIKTTPVSEFLQTKGQACSTCPNRNNGHCPGLTKLIVKPLSEVKTLDELHDGQLELVVIFDDLLAGLRRLSQQKITLAVTILSFDDTFIPLTGEELLDHLRQCFGSDNNGQIDKKKMAQAVQLLVAEFDNLLQTKIPPNDR